MENCLQLVKLQNTCQQKFRSLNHYINWTFFGCQELTNVVSWPLCLKLLRMAFINAYADHWVYMFLYVICIMQVRLIGYCFEGSLCVVYEFIENGNLSQHLHGSGENILKLIQKTSYVLLSIKPYVCMLCSVFREGPLTMVNSFANCFRFS